MQFIPDASELKVDVPFYEDANAADGWRGHSTGKTLSALKTEIAVEMERLGGHVQRFQRGTFLISEHERDGFQVHYVYEREDGTIIPGRIDVAALPVRKDPRKSKTYEVRREKALRMALFMLREGLTGARFIELLSPGYAALLPWMLGSGDVTVGQLWSREARPLLADVIEGEFDEQG